MESLTRAQFETVADKLLVFGIYRSLADFVASVSLVIENRVTYTRHMYANLVRTSSFKSAFYEGTIGKPLHYSIMGDRLLSRRVIFRVPHPIKGAVACVAP